MHTFQQITEIIQGKLLSNQQDTIIKNYIFDSRIATPSTSSVFFAISGNHHDGHAYIDELYEKGVINFVVEKEIIPPANTNVLLVQNSAKALQNLAIYHRSKFKIPVVAITGSNGKTIIKEWLSQVLSQKFQVVKSPKSYNSQIGVPLSVLQIQEENEIAIFEAGISQKGEMKVLNEIIKPTLGIFSNIGPAHDTGFKSREEKVREKWELFNGSEYVVYCKDHTLIDVNRPENCKSFTWGKSVDSNVLILSQKNVGKGTIVKLVFEEEEFSMTFPFREQAYVENAMHIVTICFSLGLSMDFIQSVMFGLKGVAMRLEVKEGINQCVLIDDTYNNDLAGFTSALEFLTNHSFGKEKTVIISDVLSSGKQNTYEELGRIIFQNSIKRLIGVGSEIKTQCANLPLSKHFFETTDQLLENLDGFNFSNEAILVKGARSFQFEMVTRKLSKKIHGTKLEINLNALVQNLNYYKSLLKPRVKIMVMVKAFGYGSGSVEIANLLDYHKVDYLAVAYPDEGVELRKRGISTPIMVMNVSREGFEKLVEYRLEPEVFSFQQLKELNSFFKSSKTSLPIHLKIETGMKRLGFEKEEIDELIKLILESWEIKIASIFTHLVGSDEEIHNEFSLHQLFTFKALTDKIVENIGYKPILHALNSPGIIRFPEHQFDMVRLGIGLYGYESCGLKQEKLEPISVLKTEISQIRKLHPGETVGYGRKGVAEKETTIATIAIGYADGFNRAFSNGKFSVSVNGKRAPIIGNVCMDMSMIDITDIPAEVGDEVIIFGKDPTIKELADAIGTIPYEILTNVSERVKRVYHSE